MFFSLLLSLPMDLSPLPTRFNTQIYLGRYAVAAEGTYGIITSATYQTTGNQVGVDILLYPIFPWQLSSELQTSLEQTLIPLSFHSLAHSPSVCENF